MIEKTVLTEVPLFTGDIKMPKGWHLERDEMVKQATVSHYYEDIDHPFYTTVDRLQTFILEYMTVEHKINILRGNNHAPSARYYERNEISKPLITVDNFNLRSSPDWVLLYGIEIDPGSCIINIKYDDNRLKDRIWKVDLETNKFIMFPAILQYFVENKNNSYLNYVQTLTFVNNNRLYL